MQVKEMSAGICGLLGHHLLLCLICVMCECLQLCGFRSVWALSKKYCVQKDGHFKLGYLPSFRVFFFEWCALNSLVRGVAKETFGLWESQNPWVRTKVSVEQQEVVAEGKMLNRWTLFTYTTTTAVKTQGFSKVSKVLLPLHAKTWSSCHTHTHRTTNLTHLLRCTTQSKIAFQATGCMMFCYYCFFFK